MSRALGNEVAYAIAEKAEKAGAKGAFEAINHVMDEYIEHNSYKVLFSSDGDENNPGGIFTIYSSGEWDWQGDNDYLTGRTMPPHSRAWQKRLVKSGVYAPLATSAVFEWRALSEESKRIRR